MPNDPRQSGKGREMERTAQESNAGGGGGGAPSQPHADSRDQQTDSFSLLLVSYSSILLTKTNETAITENKDDKRKDKKDQKKEKKRVDEEPPKKVHKTRKRMEKGAELLSFRYTSYVFILLLEMEREIGRFWGFLKFDALRSSLSIIITLL